MSRDNDAEAPHGEVLRQVESYYDSKIREHGPTPKGVDWNSRESQYLRFSQLLKICATSTNRPISILDYGCGYGTLVDAVAALGVDFSYIGFDISEEMLSHARAIHARDERCSFVSDRSLLAPVDHVVASGVMNVRMAISVEEWHRYVLDTIEQLNALSIHGFAFNALTKYSDAEKMRSDLYYADPLELFDHCKRRFSKYVALLHDYPLYEFTLLVRKNLEL